MLGDGIIDTYALGGAMAANLYVDPFFTQDFDFFVHILPAASPLDPLRPIIDYLKPLGYEPEGVEFDIEGHLVQFIPFTDELTEEATEMANVVDLGGMEIRAFSPEYLVAIMLKTGRAKDLARAKMFLDQRSVDLDALNILITRFNLERQWQRVTQL
jgi:hypothetical protein